ncbi:chemotaxis protein CheB [Capillimicrobium parvum]|uniref:Protein-glutamate methylesterase/protein-glutamine glutaminase n=1 Tax=Capillimicrobium parvum TaxID=2884022 RepID=A0A9E6XS11_9ACTN|nr:chemotaxis protein CheB [Capillimicrobium parvum]UGS33738.1 Protein-glutamate methylesterase/protein-glutamine glutaminase [Capillimicrobium parvum]
MSTATDARIVVADDSSLMRRIVANALEKEGFTVVGAAADGDEALALCRRHRPAAMTLDLTMPGLDGMGVLRELRSNPAHPASGVPVVVVSAFSPVHGARAVDALAEGAFDLVAKPAAGEPLSSFVCELGDKVRAATASRRPRLTGIGNGHLKRPAAPRTPRRVGGPAARPASRTARAVVIASSTGGPRALADLMPKLPARLGAGTLIVQHMPAGFTASLAQRLDRASRLSIVEASGTESLDPCLALLAPGGSHLRLAEGRRALLSDAPPIGALRPRADLTIVDVAAAYGERTLLVVLTGMGRDGLDGAREVKRRGGRVLVEAESSCTVYGMPRAVAEAGLADAIVDLSELPQAITQEAGA